MLQVSRLARSVWLGHLKLDRLSRSPLAGSVRVYLAGTYWHLADQSIRRVASSRPQARAPMWSSLSSPPHSLAIVSLLLLLLLGLISELERANGRNEPIWLAGPAVRASLDRPRKTKQIEPFVRAPICQRA